MNDKKESKDVMDSKDGKKGMIARMPRSRKR